MIGRVLVLCLLAFLIGGAGLYWASRKAEPFVRHDRGVKFVTYFCVVTGFLLSAFGGPLVLAVLMLLILLIGAFELYRMLFSVRGGRLALRISIGAGYFLLALALLLFVARSTTEVVVFVYLVVATFDGFSQVAGNLLGRHALMHKISPGKTVEGALGGLILSAAMAVSLRALAGLNFVQSLAVCGWIAASALSGDLLASWVKRRFGIKDFGGILPGHGGVLDRFDSLLLAGPVSLLLLHRPF
jgi:phosphatidate cytidylyltransferase